MFTIPHPLQKSRDKRSLAVCCRLKDYRGFFCAETAYKTIIVNRTSDSCRDACFQL